MMDPDPRATAVSVMQQHIDDLPIFVSAKHKAKLRSAVEEYVIAMPDVPPVTDDTARAFVRRPPRCLHGRA